MEWALQVARAHPQLQEALITADGERLSILLSDGRTFTFRPGALLDKNATQARRTEMLNQLISIGIKHAQKDSPAGNAEKEPAATSTNPPRRTPQADTPVMPIVREAGYFLRSHRGEDSMVYVPLTDFIAVGLAHDFPDTIQPIYYSQLEEEGVESGDIFPTAVLNLRQLTTTQALPAEFNAPPNGTESTDFSDSQDPDAENFRQALAIGITKIAEADVLSILHPPNYELSWFCDVEIMQQLAAQISIHRPADIPLFVPATRTNLFIVFSEDPHLADFFATLAAEKGATNAVYPLPHTIAADGWREWVPLPGSRLSEILSELRYYYRSRSYREQLNYMERWSSENSLKSYDLYTTAAGEKVTAAQWDATDGTGSVPDTEYLIFHRDSSPHPWDTAEPVHIALQAHIARELWPDGFQMDENAWPPRWEIKGFPDSATLAKFREAVDRII